MMRFLGRMLILPVTVFVSGMEILVRSMQDMQRSFEKGVDGMIRDFVGGSEDDPDEARRSPIEAAVPEDDAGKPDKIQPSQVEEQTMYNDDACEPDLSGDDVKTVSYLITFQKPDFETTLQERRDETIEYSTTAKSFAGQKLMDFMDRLRDEGIPYPSSWGNDRPSNDYDRGIDPNTGRRMLYSIPQEDRRYIDVEVRLSFRRPKQDANYDKQKVEILREIRDRIRP